MWALWAGSSYRHPPPALDGPEPDVATQTLSLAAVLLVDTMITHLKGHGSFFLHKHFHWGRADRGWEGHGGSPGSCSQRWRSVLILVGTGVCVCFKRLLVTSHGELLPQGLSVCRNFLAQGVKAKNAKSLASSHNFFPKSPSKPPFVSLCSLPWTNNFKAKLKSQTLLPYTLHYVVMLNSWTINVKISD